MTQHSHDSAPWQVREHRYDPATEALHATLFATGNRYLGLRGSFEEIGSPGVQGMFVSGVFVKTRNYYWPHGDTYFKKRYVFLEDLEKDERREKTIVNALDPLCVRVWIGDQLFRMYQGEILEYQRTLDLRVGVVRRRLRWQDDLGRITAFDIERFCDMANTHCIRLRYRIQPENYSAPIRVESGLDTRVPTIGQDDLVRVSGCEEREAVHGMVLTQQADNPEITLSHGVAHRLYAQHAKVGPKWSFMNHNDRMFCSVASFEAEKGCTYVLEKNYTVHTTNDAEPTAPAERVKDDLRAPVDYAGALEAHRRAWDELWAQCNIEIVGVPDVERAVRFNIFHLLAVAPVNDLASVGAKTLSGEGYKAYVFWDTDVYIAPFYYFNLPEAGRNLVGYRHRGLGAARHMAKAKGLAGARYPWEAADTGEEECWEWLPSGMNQLHVVADVALSVLRYGEVTGDTSLVAGKGHEIVFEAARFYVSRIEYNEQNNYYELRRVCGPDEYHPVCDNNAYTNYTAKWLLNGAAELANKIKTDQPELWADLAKRLGLEESEIEQWTDHAARMFLPEKQSTPVIEQFEGFFKLDRSWTTRGASYGGPSAEYHLCQGQKQPDTLLLLALYPHLFTDAQRTANWDYYEPTTEHGSSLSVSIHGLLACQMGMPYKAEEYFHRAIHMDLHNVNGDSAAGIHAASCAGVWLALTGGFGGVQFQDNILSVNPCLPFEWDKLRFRLVIRGETFTFTISRESVEILRSGETAEKTFDISVYDKPAEFDCDGRIFARKPARGEKS